jgi:hypothetical protein
VTAAIQLQDDKIVGIGMDKGLWVKDSVTSGWTQVPASTAVISITQLRDGTLLGVGTDNKLYTRGL